MDGFETMKRENARRVGMKRDEEDFLPRRSRFTFHVLACNFNRPLLHGRLLQRRVPWGL